MIALAKIGKILSDYSLTGDELQIEDNPLMRNMKEQMEQEERLTFILPAFPAKSPSREKTIGELPDFGEVLALRNLQNLCNKISDIYLPGAELVICSDGRVFSDVVNVPDDSIDLYNEGIQSILSEYGLHSLRIFAMDHLYPDTSPSELRNLLIDIYAMDLNEIKNLVRSDLNYHSLFNGIHRFLCEDELSINPSLSRSAAQRKTKEQTYELLRRSDAWSSLLNSHFPKALRLSIHPHASGHEKFGIKLVPSSNKWATPWHNVVVKHANGFELMHRRDALNLNAILRMERDKYAYFEIPTV